MLTVELLEELKLRWDRGGWPIASTLQPGLPSDEIERQLAALDLRAPAELRTWWGWHNGAEAKTLGGILPHAFVSLDSAVELTMMMRRIAVEVAGEEDAPTVWTREWLVLSYDGLGGDLVVDTEADHEVTPVLARLSVDAPPDVPVAMPSMGALITTWIDMIDGGATTWDASTGLVKVVQEQVPDDYPSRMR